MIESCPKKRMFFSLTILGILTIFVLIAESNWTNNTEARNTSKKSNFIVEQNSTCWKEGPYTVIKDCEPCSAFEVNSGSIGVCIKTHFKELLRCSNGEVVLRSCDKAAYLDEKQFWIFEGFMFVIAFISFFCANLRWIVLYRRMIRKLQQQLVNSV